MDFLENRFLAQNQNQRKSYVYRERRTYELLHELEDEEFRINFRFSKERVKELAHTLDNVLGYVKSHFLNCD